MNRRTPGVPLGLAGVLACALAIAGCTSSAPASGAATTAGGPARADVTLAQARQVWDRFQAAAARVGPLGSSDPALPLETGPERAYASASATITAGIMAAMRKDARTKGSMFAISELSIVPAGPPTFYLPEQSGYPRFFVAQVTNKYAKGKTPAPTTAQLRDGTQTYLLGPQLMLFEQAKAGASWLLADVATLAVGETVPRLAADSAGYVPTVSLSDTALLTRPADTGAQQAAVVDDGPGSAAAKAVADGPLTTGLYHGAAAHDIELTPPHGDDYQWALEGANYPQFALRTAAGGALVFYAMTLTNTVAVPDVINKADPVKPGSPIRVAPDVQALLPAAMVDPRVEVSAVQTLTFAAVDPPAGAGKIQVIAMDGGLTAASAS